ncbi:LytTR family DNA-binding domain-containing protein, partial [uncultured Parabacteroides sp.]
MKALIIEDEKAAVRNLQALLSEVAPDMEILAVLDSITETIDWFGTHDMPDLVFLDIHLADGSAFEIFGHVEISCPIIFTTAYDEYALKAFKVNSI